MRGGGESARGRIVSVPCCAKPVWINIRDLGTANALEFDLGRCADCGQYVMHIYYQGTSGYWVVAEEDAAELLEAAPGPERKALINRWLDKVEFWERS